MAFKSSGAEAHNPETALNAGLKACSTLLCAFRALETLAIGESEMLFEAAVTVLLHGRGGCKLRRSAGCRPGTRLIDSQSMPASCLPCRGESEHVIMTAAAIEGILG